MSSLVLLRGILAARLRPTSETIPIADVLLRTEDMPAGWRSGGRRAYRNGIRNAQQSWAIHARRARLNSYVQGFHEGRGLLGGGSSNVTVYLNSDDAHQAFEFLKGQYIRNPRAAPTVYEAGRSELTLPAEIGDEHAADVLAVARLGKGSPGEQLVVRWRRGRFISAVSLGGEAGRFSADDLRRLARVQDDRVGALIDSEGA